MCEPGVRPAAATLKAAPMLRATTVPSTDQSTLTTVGSMTLTVRVVGFVTAPAGGTTESHGFEMMRQMSMIIFSRDTELKLVSGSLPNKLFIIELSVGR